MTDETNILPIQPDFDKEVRNWKELGLFDGDDE